MEVTQQYMISSHNFHRSSQIFTIFTDLHRSVKICEDLHRSSQICEDLHRWGLKMDPKNLHRSSQICEEIFKKLRNHQF